MNDAATQPGATNKGQPPAAPTPDPDTVLAPEHVPNPRDAILNGMDDRIDAARISEQREYLLENAEELGLDINDPAIPPAKAPVEPDPKADGAQVVQPMHPSAKPASVAPPEGFEQHEMAQYIVMHAGEPHLKTKVHGVDKLIPMSRVQAQVQKLDAAEVSLQESTRFKKELDQRDVALRQNEAALQSRMGQLTTPPPDPGAVNEQLVGEAREIISTLFRGDEDTAAKGLADLLTRTRAPANPAPAFDATQIANQAAAVAVSTMTQIELEKDAVKGLEEFTNVYPEIMADTALYQIADKMTDVIEGEHPEWPPSKLMMEAGKRTKEWLARQRGEASPEDPTSPQPPANLDTNRQERKESLVRIPNPALGAVSPHGVTEETVETPHDTIAAIREARGQPAL